MTHRRVVVLLCVVAAVLVAPATVAQESPTPTANTTNESDGADMGTQLTAFLQSSSAAANDSVENGMWNARFERANASQRAGLVTNRTGSLERRLEQLRDRNESIQAAYANGSLSQPAYIAQQSRLTARISALRAAINDTDTAAGEAGVNDSRLETLRQNASELTGPQVATVASGLGNGPPASAGPPDNGTAGPPSNAGPPGNGTEPGGQPGNGTAGPPDGVGPSGNETAAGSPGTGTGPPGNQSSNAGGTGANETEGSGGDGNGGASAGPPDGDAPRSGEGAADGNGSGGANGEQGNGSGEGAADGSGTGESSEAGSDDRNDGTNSGAGNGSGSENGNSGSSGAESGNGSGSENGDNGGSGSGGAGDGNPGNGGPP